MMFHRHPIVQIAFWLLVAAFALHAIFALIPTPVFGDDSPVHLWWLEDFVAMRANGIRYPRWMHQAFGGLGSPAFYFYPPMMYFLGDLVASVTQQVDGTYLFQHTQLVALCLSMGTCYLFLRTIVGERYLAVLGSLLYGLAPYRYLNVFSRSALAEHGAFIWLPIIFLGIEYLAKDTRESRWKSVICCTIGAAGITLTNIPSTCAAIIVIPIYAAIRLDWTRPLSILAVGVGSCMLTVLICMVYLLPIASHTDLIQLDKLTEFETMGSSWHHSLFEIWAPGIRSRSVLWIAVLSLTTAAIALWYSRSLLRRDRLVHGMMAVCGVCIFLQLPYLSDSIWDLLPPLQLVQFSWRLTGPLTLVVVVLLMIGVTERKRFASALCLTIAAMSLFWYGKYLYVFLTFPPPPDMVGEVRKAPREFVPRYAERQYAATLERGRKRLLKNEHVTGLGLTDVKLKEDVSGLSFSYAAESAVAARIDVYYWPNWVLSTAGNTVPVSYDSTGAITATLPAGTHDASLAMEQSDSERYGASISLFGIALLCGCCVKGYLVSRNTHTTPSLKTTNAPEAGAFEIEHYMS